MHIRNFQPADRDQVVKLWNDVFNNPTGRNEPHGSIDRKEATDDGLFFVGVDGDKIIGTIMAGYDGHRGWIYSVAVSAKRRHIGLGTALVRHAEQALAKLGCPKINLQILPDNAEVVAFYESLGFHTEERISMGKIISE